MLLVQPAVGDFCFHLFPHDNFRLVRVTHTGLRDGQLYCTVAPVFCPNEEHPESPVGPAEVPGADLLPSDPQCRPDCPRAPRDLLEMATVDKPNILHQIRDRYWRQDIYSQLGPITVAVNPFEELEHYSAAHMQEYLQCRSDLQALDARPVHLWSVAHRAYYEMLSGQPQSVLVSGESGAGKTESCKILVRYLAALSTAFQGAEVKAVAEAVAARVLQASPVLEAFGNARTVRNDNSSRFGKFVRLRFDARRGFLRRCDTEVYLLEKTRVVAHATGERSYHIFYQLLAGADAPQRERRGLQDPDAFPWLFAGVPLQHQDPDRDRADYRAVVRALGAVGIDAGLQAALFDLVAGVMHLQSLDVLAGPDGAARFDDAGARRLRVVGGLWGLDAAGSECLRRLLTMVAIRDSVKPLTRQQAVDMRDALSKAVYEGAFLWLVRQLNRHVGGEGAGEGEGEGEGGGHWVGVLDLFGFENLRPDAPNGLEQLLINHANEQLQDYYDECVEQGMNEYALEGLDTTGLDLELPNRRKISAAVRAVGLVLDLLGDQNNARNGTDAAFLQAVVDAVGPARRGEPQVVLPPRHADACAHATPRLQRSARDWGADTVLGVDHFAEVVWYTVFGDGQAQKGWVHKNAEAVQEELQALLRSGRHPLIGSVVPEVPARGKRPTVGAVFKRSLRSLMALIRQTDPKWVRCVKPSDQKQPRRFCGAKVVLCPAAHAAAPPQCTACARCPGRGCGCLRGAGHEGRGSVAVGAPRHRRWSGGEGGSSAVSGPVRCSRGWASTTAVAAVSGVRCWRFRPRPFSCELPLSLLPNPLQMTSDVALSLPPQSGH